MQSILSFTVRAAIPERDFVAFAGIMTEASTTPVSEAELHEWEARRWEGMVRQRFAAEEAGRVIGYGLSLHQAWVPAGRFEVWVAVSTPRRGRGVGGRLYQEALGHAREHGATVVTSEVREGDAAGMRFAEQRGFRVERHLFESQLDVAAFDETRFAGVVETVEATGIRFFSLAERDTPEIRRGLYEVNRATVLDIPGWVGDFMSFGDFEQMLYSASWYLPEGQILAADGDRVIGLAALGFNPGQGSIYNNMTGVLPEYRGRKIALALKLLAIRLAKQKGYRCLRTSNDSENAPMLAINRKLGYQPEAGVFRLIREL